jgi:hypothetical protein
MTKLKSRRQALTLGYFNYGPGTYRKASGSTTLVILIIGLENFSFFPPVGKFSLPPVGNIYVNQSAFQQIRKMF